MRAVDIIMKKRGIYLTRENGERYLSGGIESTELTHDEIEFLVKGYVAGEISDYQMSAWLMAVFFNGMTYAETALLTYEMLYSGDVIKLHGYEEKGLRGPFVDKHSTGGVGDKISLILAPMVAACGVQIPMMSGRALGHTGGTLDKLESIGGYNVNLDADTFRSYIAKTGFAMTGQTKQIVPADKLLYALRDVTGTVESVPLITASILSKKIAEGSDALVFDVKFGSGAFMKSVVDAELLANSLVKTAQAMGKKASAILTDMNTPLGFTVGNFLEVEETIDCLENHGPEDVMEETYALGAEMILLAEKASTEKEARAMCEEAIKNGSALKVFWQNVKDQGGNPEKVMEQKGKRRSPHHVELKAEKDGYIKVDAYKTGLAGVDLGVGRNKTTDDVCAEAGIIFHVKTDGSASVKKGDVIMDVYGKNDTCMDGAVKRLQDALSYSDTQFEKQPLILKTIR